MPINSKSKGKRGELELSKVLTSLWGIPCRRGQQFKGTPDSPDVVCDTLDRFHIECKRVQSLNLNKAFDQAVADASDEQIPIVMHRKDNCPWMLSIALEDAREFAEYLIERINNNEESDGVQLPG